MAAVTGAAFYATGDDVVLREVNRRDASGEHRYHYSLTQRVFIVFQRATRPLDRRDVMDALNIGAEGLEHAMRRLGTLGAIQPVAGVYGFYALVADAAMPEDTRGRNPKSHGNRGKRGAADVGVPSEAA